MAIVDALLRSIRRMEVSPLMPHIIGISTVDGRGLAPVGSRRRGAM